MGMDLPKFHQPIRATSTPRYWNLLENLMEQEAMSCQSSQSCCRTKSLKKSVEKTSNSKNEEAKMKVQVNKETEENKAIVPTTKTISKNFMSNVSCHGHKFKAENLDVQVVNGDVLIVKAEDDEEKFE